MKLFAILLIAVSAGSLSSWRAWIEIGWRGAIMFNRGSRSPHGERGLKYVRRVEVVLRQIRRSPHGERGLKSWFDGLNDSLRVALLMESVD